MTTVRESNCGPWRVTAFAPNKEELAGEWGYLIKKRLQNSDSSTDLIGEIIWEMIRGEGGWHSTHGKKVNAYKILTGKPKAKARLGRSRCRWKDKI